MLKEKITFGKFIRFILGNPFSIFILVVLLTGLTISIYKIYYHSKPEIQAEIQLKQCAEKIGFENKYVVVELPVFEETEKLLKKEHYEVYKKLKEKQEVIYKKNNKE